MRKQLGYITILAAAPFRCRGLTTLPKGIILNAVAFSSRKCSQFEIVVKEGILVWSSCGKKLEIFELSRATLD